MIPARLHALFAVFVCGCAAPAPPAPVPEHRHTAPATALAAKIEYACKKAKPTPDGDLSVDVAALLGAPVKDRLEFLFDGQSFLPTPKTARTLKSL